MQSTRALRQNGPGKFGDPNKFKLKEQRNGVILGGLAIASVVGVLYMIRNRDVRQQTGPVTKDKSSQK